MMTGCSAAKRRQRGDAVVGLAALRDFQPDAQGPHHALDGFQLAHQVFGRGIAVGLVEGNISCRKLGPLPSCTKAK